MRAHLLVGLLFLLTFTGCMSLTISPNRVPHREEISVAPGVFLGSTGAITLNVPLLVDHADFFPSSFRIRALGEVLYIDPVGLDETTSADFILITHAHGDHFSPSDLRKIVKSSTVILCPIEVAKNLAGFPVRVVQPVEHIDLGTLSVDTLPAYNLRPVFPGLKPHDPSDKNVGYSFSFGGVKFLHVGDTDVLPELEALQGIDVALVPIEGGNLTMSTPDAAKLVNRIHPQIVVPMHYGLQTQVSEFSRLVDPTMRVINLDGRSTHE